MFPEALTAYERLFIKSFNRDRNVRSLDKAITLCESASSHYLDGHPFKSGHLFRLGIVLEKKGLKDEAIGAYERALDAAVDFNDLMIICFKNIGALSKGRYDRLGEAEDLDKAIWAQEMCIACSATDPYTNVRLCSFYESLLASLTARWELLKHEEDLDQCCPVLKKLSH